ncbi:MAG: HDOD domain-containing protein [Gammaproteobacteria bacterium]|nr:HDOD domain-containing protein [Gammaproteobacteria bacterium]
MSDIFIARQPIFDANLSVHAYELLFRKSAENDSENVTDSDLATSNVLMNSLIDIGLNNLVSQHMAYLNLSESFLINPDLIVIPSDQAIIEVSKKNIVVDSFKTTLNELKKRGFTIALEGFTETEEIISVFDCIDIISLDVTQQNQWDIKATVEQLKTHKVDLVATKIDTHEEFEFYKKLGIKYFQGAFFARPELVQGKSIAPKKLSILQLVAKVNNPQIKISELSEIISTDVSLSHKVFKFINSPISGLRTTIDSIQQAVTLLGLSTIKNWVTVMALTSNADKPLELSTTALIRANICLKLAQRNELDKPDNYFTVGLFSNLDAMMDQSFENLMQELPLSNEAKQGLIAHKGEYGEALECAIAMENIDFTRLDFMGLDLSEMSELHLESIKWADDLLRTVH